jgi:hypothetical protein
MRRKHQRDFLNQGGNEMPSIRTLQQIVLAGAFTLATSLAFAGNGPPPSPPYNGDNDDTDLVVMIALGLAIASSVDCASNAPSIPGCDDGGSLRGSLGN